MPRLQIEMKRARKTMRIRGKDKPVKVWWWHITVDGQHVPTHVGWAHVREDAYARAVRRLKVIQSREVAEA